MKTLHTWRPRQLWLGQNWLRGQNCKRK